jgi:hypothetical protein
LCGDKKSYQDGKSCDYDGREQTDCDNLQIPNGQYLTGVDYQYNLAIKYDATTKNYEITDPVAYLKLQYLKERYDIIPSAEVDLPNELPGVFHGENNEAFSSGMKPVVDYKIKILTGNLLNLSKDAGLLPTQIQTFQQATVVYWNTLRDTVYGDPKVPGSADKLLETARRGMGWNPNLFDRVHFSY